MKGPIIKEGSNVQGPITTQGSNVQEHLVTLGLKGSNVQGPILSPVDRRCRGPACTSSQNTMSTS